MSMSTSQSPTLETQTYQTPHVEPISSVDVEMLEHKNLLTFIACGSYSFLAQSRWLIFLRNIRLEGKVVKNVTHTQTPAFHGPVRSTRSGFLVLTPASRLTRFFPSIVADPPAIIEVVITGAGTLVKKKFQHISAKVAWR
ncbi:hypothetical protein B0H13DRAFT_1901531 [Mycena leptocephala]|nr:hypothetical protein B0H13DRAFT_1901531 [Mycena leptocephala]